MTEDFYINYKNMKISYIKKHLQKFNQNKKYNNFSDILEKDKIKNLLKFKVLIRKL